MTNEVEIKDVWFKRNREQMRIGMSRNSENKMGLTIFKNYFSSSPIPHHVPSFSFQPNKA